MLFPIIDFVLIAKSTVQFGGLFEKWLVRVNDVFIHPFKHVVILCIDLLRYVVLCCAMLVCVFIKFKFLRKLFVVYV